MKILERQFEVMLQVDEGQWLDFVCRALEVSRPMSPLHALEGAARRLKARDWCDRARANGLRTDDEILGFVFLMHELAPNFDQHPYIRAILDRDDEPVAQRWRRLFDARDEALERAWREVDRVGASSARDWHVEECASIEEAFPATHRDPRFARYFREVKARHAADPPPEGG
jgi:hypothetical protein